MTVAPAIYYIGPESSVYHVTARCPALHTPDRYYPLHKAEGERRARIMNERRACKRCSSS